MYLGVVGLVPPDPLEITPDVARRVREAGFTGVSCFFSEPLRYSEDDAHRIRQALLQGGVVCAQANARYPDLVHPDPAQRAEGVRQMRHMCRIARALEACILYVRPGSRNPAGSWYPHPENRSPETRRVLVESLRQVADTAEELGVTLALEGHVLSPLWSAEVVREVLKAVNSPALRFNMDPVNFVGCVEDAYDTTSLLGRLFDLLGPYTVGAHAKDFLLQNRLVLHVEETVIGRGLMDQATFLQLMDRWCPDGFVLIEHLPDEDIPEARDALNRFAQEAGVEWDVPPGLP